MSKIKELKGGLTNTVLHSENCVVKKYSTDSLIQGFGKNPIDRMNTEFGFLKYFSKLEIAPRPLNLNLKHLELEIEYFPSITVDSLCYGSKELSPELINLITESLNTLHQPTKENKSLNLHSYTSQLITYIHKTKAILEFARVDTDALINWIKVVEEVKKDKFEKVPSSLIHGDFWLNNILVNQEGDKVKIIDWEFGALDTPYIDLGTYFIYSQDYSNLQKVYSKNYLYSSEIDEKLVHLFATYRIIKLLSFIDLEIYKQANPEERFSFSYMTNLLKNILTETNQ